MKKLVTLVMLFMSCYVVHAQRALTASILLQNSGQHYGVDDYINNKIVTKYYSTVQLPTIALGYMHFGYRGGYVRWYLSGWRYKKLTDEVSVYDPFTGLFDVHKVNVVHFGGGRIGFSRGFQIAKIKDKIPICLELSVTGEWQIADYKPFSSSEFHRRITTTVTQVGPNIVLHRNFEKGFLRFVGLLPVFQMKTEYYRLDDPSIPSSGKAKTATYFEGTRWESAGAEIGAGYYFSKE